MNKLAIEDAKELTQKIKTLGENVIATDFDALNLLISIISPKNKLKKIKEAHHAGLKPCDIFRKNPKAQSIFTTSELNMACAIKKLIEDFQWKQLKSKPIQTPSEVVDFLRSKLNTDDSLYIAIFLSQKNRIIDFDSHIGAGCSESSMFYPRKILERAIWHNATNVILAHQCPHGIVEEPTQNEVFITSVVAKALKSFDMQLVDHLVLGADNFLSYFSHNTLTQNALNGISPYSSNINMENQIKLQEQVSKYNTTKKQTTINRNNQIIKDFHTRLDELAKKLDSPETKKNILDMFSFFGRFHRFSFFNNCYLSLQACARGTYVEQFASFKRWTTIKVNGKQVRIKPGEKAYDVFVPIKVNQYLKDDNGNFILDENKQKIPILDKDSNNIKVCTGFIIGKVFDINQTNAKELGLFNKWYHVKGKVSQEILEKTIKNIKEKCNVNIVFVPNVSGQQSVKGAFNPKSNTIEIVDSLPNEGKLKTLFHECGHFFMHKDKPLEDLEKQRSSIEGEAEAFSYALSSAFGIEPTSDVYIGSWGQSGKELREKIEKIQKAICDFIHLANLDTIIDQIICPQECINQNSNDFENQYEKEEEYSIKT